MLQIHRFIISYNYCRDYKCKIFQRYFEGYGEQKRFGVGKALNEWILCIDADEYLTWDLVSEIKEELKDPANYSGYKIPMNLVFRGKEFRFGKESNTGLGGSIICFI